MNFEIGDALSRALHITWRHKSFWGFVFLPMLISFLVIPIYFLPLIFLDGNSSDSAAMIENPVFVILFFIFHLVFTVASLVLTTLGYSSLTLGIVRVERGEERLAFRELLKDGMKYFPRMLGVLLLVFVGFSLILFAVFAFLILLGALTAGIGFICAQPFFILLYPMAMMVYAFSEQAQAALVADEMGVMEAIRRGWGLLKANFWGLVLISFIIYLGISIVTSIVVMPFMIPLFFLPFLFESSNFDMQTFGLTMAGFMLFLLPVMALVQGVTMTYVKSCYILVYLRLTRSSNAPLALESAG